MGGWPGGWPGGWLEKVKIEQSSASAGLKLAEFGNIENRSCYLFSAIFFTLILSKIEPLEKLLIK